MKTGIITSINDFYTISYIKVVYLCPHCPHIMEVHIEKDSKKVIKCDYCKNHFLIKAPFN